MSIAPQLLTVPSEKAEQRLDNFLLAQLKGVPKSCLYRLLRQGNIRVNKKRKKPTYRIQADDIIRLPQITVGDTSATQAKPSASLSNRLKEAILFENEAFLVINKPYGIAVHGGSGISLGLIESLRQIYPKHAHLELVHRLDRETSGCLLIAKKPSILKDLHVLFREKEIKKTYLMLTRGYWPKNLTHIDRPLQKNKLQSGERMVKIHEEGQSALTQFNVQQHFDTASLVEVILHTGRTHQIRVHAQYAKHPIAGDKKYGDEGFNQKMKTVGLKRLFLHAHQLNFMCPVEKKPIHITAPLPSELASVLKKTI